ncbi:hypothetical protein [Pseudodesulfovibrio profundus]|nr:hypothetical protein [Pseudodesulfovibrio profundus]
MSNVELKNPFPTLLISLKGSCGSAPEREIFTSKRVPLAALLLELTVD